MGLFNSRPKWLAGPIAAAALVATVALFGGAVATAAGTVAVDTAIKPYKPQKFPAPPAANRGYFLPDGSINIAGYDDASGFIALLNQRFTKAHKTKFNLDMKGNATGIVKLMYDKSLFTVMGDHAVILQAVPYEKVVGYRERQVPPLAIRIAHASPAKGAKLGPIGVIVHPGSKLQSLTTEQVKRIFSEGAVGGNITSWNQLGIPGETVPRALAPVGMQDDPYLRPEDPTFGEYLIYRHFDGNVFAPNYQRYLKHAEVVARVSSDPNAIGIVSLGQVTPDVRVVPIVTADGTITSGSAQDVAAGKYPYDRFLYIYVRRTPNDFFDHVRRTPAKSQPTWLFCGANADACPACKAAGHPSHSHDTFEPIVKEYLRLVLSREGQQAIADDGKYLPLNAREVREELARLEAASKEWHARPEPRNIMLETLTP